MALNGANEQRQSSAALAQFERRAADGCESHPFVHQLCEESGPKLGPDLADAVHLLCALHGHYPGLIAIAESRCEDGDLSAWLGGASESFERERAYLLHLTAAVGPIPSTPGAAETESSLAAARHAVETLANSERSGCALGAVCALIADWPAIRAVLDRAALRNGIEGPVPTLPDRRALGEVIDHVADNPAAARALAFGSEQLLLQHRALFALLEARSESRGDY